MDLFCPHCTRRVTVPDDKAGTVLNCPLCTKQFMAPSLAPPPAVPPLSSTPVETYGMGAAPAPPPSSQPAAAPQPASMSSQPAPAPPAPPPPVDYTRSLVF